MIRSNYRSGSIVPVHNHGPGTLPMSSRGPIVALPPGPLLSHCRPRTSAGRSGLARGAPPINMWLEGRRRRREACLPSPSWASATRSKTPHLTQNGIYLTNGFYNHALQIVPYTMIWVGSCQLFQPVQLFFCLLYYIYIQFWFFFPISQV